MSKQTSIYLKDALEKISTLEAENAALWAFVRADDEMDDCVDPDNEWRDCYEAEKALHVTREALRQYEAQP